MQQSRNKAENLYYPNTQPTDPKKCWRTPEQETLHYKVYNALHVSSKMSNRILYKVLL